MGPRSFKQGPPCSVGWAHRACGGRGGSGGQTKHSSPGGCGGQGGKPQSAARVIPQSERDKGLPALGGFYLCCGQREKSVSIPSLCGRPSPAVPTDSAPNGLLCKGAEGGEREKVLPQACGQDKGDLHTWGCLLWGRLSPSCRWTLPSPQVSHNSQGLISAEGIRA